MTKEKQKAKVVYTCITGGYDELVDHQFIHPDWDYICFSDTARPSNRNASWKIVPTQYTAKDESRTNRWHKINPHLFLQDYTYSVYMDANIDVVSEGFFSELNSKIDTGKSFAVMAHNERDCVYDELKVCIQLQLDDPKTMQDQINIYKKEKYPAHNGLYANSILLRNHNNKIVIKIMNEWWDWVNNHSRRDQLSLPYVLWKYNYTPARLPFKYFDNESGILYFWPHTKDLRDLANRLNQTIKELRKENTLLQARVEGSDDKLRMVKTSNNRTLKNRVARMLHRGGRKNV
jgi:hypothetical protein